MPRLDSSGYSAKSDQSEVRGLQDLVNDFGKPGNIHPDRWCPAWILVGTHYRILPGPEKSDRNEALGLQYLANDFVKPGKIQLDRFVTD